MPDADCYLRPDTLEIALAALGNDVWRIAAGCTDILPATEHKVLQGPVLDITGISGLRGISKTADGLRIGATTTWGDIARASLPPACFGLQMAARQVGALQIQNRGTIAGNLCNASPAADGVPPLLTLDAVVELQSASGRRRIDLSEFITGARQTVLAKDEMITAVHIPQTALAGQGNFLKLGARRYLVISIVMAAANVVLRDGVVVQAALSIGSCSPVATRLPQVEAAMVGRPFDPAMLDAAQVAAAISPIDDIRADAAYRAQTATTLLRRTVAATVQAVSI